jgi:hypothetical protein
VLPGVTTLVDGADVLVLVLDEVEPALDGVALALAVGVAVVGALLEVLVEVATALECAAC